MLSSGAAGAPSGPAWDSGGTGSSDDLATLLWTPVYLHAYDSVSEARHGLERYFNSYHQRRPHAALDGRTPDSVYFHSLPVNRVA